MRRGAKQARQNAAHHQPWIVVCAGGEDVCHRWWRIKSLVDRLRQLDRAPLGKEQIVLSRKPGNRAHWIKTVGTRVVDQQRAGQ